jgi:hypothetical protein
MESIDSKVDSVELLKDCGKDARREQPEAKRAGSKQPYKKMASIDSKVDSVELLIDCGKDSRREQSEEKKAASKMPYKNKSCRSGSKLQSIDETAETFDVEKSTEDLWCVPHFVGDHKDIRPLLDYSWHGTYKHERLRVQDEIIHKLCSNQSKSSLLPWVVFTAGAMGAGKGFVTRWMDQKGYFPLKEFVVVDPDQVRQMLPEWDKYVAHDPEAAGDKTQKEAGQIAEILGYKALRESHRLIFDGSLRDADWYVKYLQKLREQFPGVRIMILHVMSEQEEVLRRAEERGKQTGRVVPREILLASMDAVPKSVHALAPHCDFCCRILNRAGQDPQLLREPDAPFPIESVNLDWDAIKGLWENPDMDRDGQLSQEELAGLLKQGRVTQQVIQTMDLNGDGCISTEEVKAAELKALDNGTTNWR